MACSSPIVGKKARANRSANGKTEGAEAPPISCGFLRFSTGALGGITTSFTSDLLLKVLPVVLLKYYRRKVKSTTSSTFEVLLVVVGRVTRPPQDLNPLQIHAIFNHDIGNKP